MLHNQHQTFDRHQRHRGELDRFNTKPKRSSCSPSDYGKKKTSCQRARPMTDTTYQQLPWSFYEINPLVFWQLVMRRHRHLVPQRLWSWRLFVSAWSESRVRPLVCVVVVGLLKQCQEANFPSLLSFYPQLLECRCVSEDYSCPYLKQKNETFLSLFQQDQPLSCVVSGAEQSDTTLPFRSFHQHFSLSFGPRDSMKFSTNIFSLCS